MDADESGSATAELVLVTPILVLLLLLIVFASQGSHFASTVKHAADSAARAASMEPNHRMATAARVAAQSDLEGSELHCGSLEVEVHIESAGHTRLVVVTVLCGMPDGDFVLLGNRQRTFEATSSEVIDVYRAG